MEDKYNSGEIEVKKVDLMESPQGEIIKLPDTRIGVDQVKDNSEINTLEQMPELEETVPNVYPLPPSEKKNIEPLKTLDNGKVKISMRSFLLENKSLLSRVENEKVPCETEKTYVDN